MNDKLLEGKVIWDLSRITDRQRTRIEFPELIRFQDHWYCGFREGEIHNNHPSGRARIIRSRDGEHWETAKLIEWDCGDVREPKFSITAEGVLMMNTSVAFVSRRPRQPAPPGAAPQGYTPPEARRADDKADRFYQLEWFGTPMNVPHHGEEPYVGQQSMTWLSHDGLNWSSAYACPNGVNGWIWNTTWNQGMGYGVSQWGKDNDGAVYRTRDGRSWRRLVHGIFPEHHGGEVALAFDDDEHIVALLRGDNHAKIFIGHAQAPYYQNWTWTIPSVDWDGNGTLRPVQELFGVGVGGPKLLRLRDGRFVAAGRVLGPPHDDGRVTLFWLDPKRHTLTRFAQCDGTSYPGVVEHGDELWITYIDRACHDDRWEIRLARIKTPAMA